MSTLAATDVLAEALARIASALRIPVLALALLVLLLCALEAGRFAVELCSRTRAGRRAGARSDPGAGARREASTGAGRRALGDLTRRILAEPRRAATLSIGAPSPLARDALLDIARATLAGEPAGVEHALADYELAVQRRLDHTRILVRVGPALGLMGTLIPLAPGLAALGHGEVGTLATDLRTAFAATTIGLLVGTVAFALTLARTRMYTEDLTALERAVEPAVTPAARADPGPARAPAPPEHLAQALATTPTEPTIPPGTNR